MSDASWRPTAAHDTLKARADLAHHTGEIERVEAALARLG